MSFPRYPKYKPSGVEWLGDLPEHWSIVPLRHVADCLDGLRVPLNAEQRAACPGAVPYWGANCVVDHVETALISEPVVLLGEDGAPFFDKAKDIAFYIDEPIWPNNHVHVLRPRCVVQGRYLAAALNTTDYSRFIDGSTRDKLTQTAMSAIPIPMPPLPEQRAIAAFLDRETAKIDALVAEQQRLIELLKEKRQAVISHAVTKGLDPTVPMKPSGVEWIGDVPSHWRIVRNKALFQEVDERSEAGEEELLTVSHLTGVTRRSEKDVNMFMAESLEGYKRCRKGDLVINTMWAWMGAVGASPLNGVVSPAYNVYRLRDPGAVNCRYYDLLSRTPAHRTEMKANSTGVWESRLRLYPNRFLDMRSPVPPKSEQNAITERLSVLLCSWDRVLNQAKVNIGLLQERRSALISAAVTGQIDVRNAVTVEAA